MDHSRGSAGVDKREQEELLRRLIDAYRSSVRVYLARFEFNQADADEIVADVFMLAYECLDELTKLEPLASRSWLLRTARNLAANSGRRGVTRRRAVERLRHEPLPFAASPEDEFMWQLEAGEQEARAQQVREVLAELDAEHQRLLAMHAFGYTGSDMAQVLGTTNGAARQRLSRARSAFRAAYELRVGTPFGPAGEP